MRRTPVIDLTDLYHPYQDLGDNLDLPAAYCLPGVDLRAVILDVTERFRAPHFDHPRFGRMEGPRDPGHVAVFQLNHLSGRAVPHATGPFAAMRSPEDTMPGLDAAQAVGVELFLRALREAPAPVEVLVFSSLRVLAVAYNREPGLVRARVALVRVSAGADTPGVPEWNVELDPHAMACVVRSGLPLALYPCASAEGPFALGRHNTYWKMPTLAGLAECEPGLRRYCAYAFEQEARADFLRAVEERELAPGTRARLAAKAHHVWETQVWAHAADLRLVRRAEGAHRLVPAAALRPGDVVLLDRLRPCRLEMLEDGTLAWTPSTTTTGQWIYEREDPEAQQCALIEAWPALYREFRLRPEGSAAVRAELIAETVAAT
jgi:pyrimidine-specific ribonucleoside hydrolase